MSSSLRGLGVHEYPIILPLPLIAVLNRYNYVHEHKSTFEISNNINLILILYLLNTTIKVACAIFLPQGQIDIIYSPTNLISSIE